MKYSRLTPCAECPFRKASAPGWLGPDKDAEKLVNQILGPVPVAGGFLVGTEPVERTVIRR